MSASHDATGWARKAADHAADLGGAGALDGASIAISSEPSKVEK